MTEQEILKEFYQLWIDPLKEHTDILEFRLDSVQYNEYYIYYYKNHFIEYDYDFGARSLAEEPDFSAAFKIIYDIDPKYQVGEELERLKKFMHDLKFKNKFNNLIED